MRLRIPSQYFSGEMHFLPVLEKSALIREVHVFGDQLGFGVRSDGTGQHMGFGKKMMAHAEEIVHNTYPAIQKIAVISGV